MPRAFWLVVVSAAALGLAAGCSSSNKCKKACDKMEKCALGDAGAGEAKTSSGSFNCPFSAACNPKEECQAACYLDADCPAVLSGAGAALTPCLQQCATIKTDGGGDTGPGGDGPIKLDKGGPCTPQCGGRVCGPDGCGGSCGGCTPPTFCNTYGQCTNNCTPNCAGRQCGGDGCGGTCGSCAPPTVCNTQGQCACNPDCSGKVCGDDGCGGSCGSCTPPLVCDPTGQCVTTCTRLQRQAVRRRRLRRLLRQLHPAGDLQRRRLRQQDRRHRADLHQPEPVQAARRHLPLLRHRGDQGDLPDQLQLHRHPLQRAQPEHAVLGLRALRRLGPQLLRLLLRDLGTSYACPNSYDFDCTALDPTAPTIKLCLPKP